MALPFYGAVIFGFIGIENTKLSPAARLRGTLLWNPAVNGQAGLFLPRMVLFAPRRYFLRMETRTAIHFSSCILRALASIISAASSISCPHSSAVRFP